jgi:hypothetical protein
LNKPKGSRTDEDLSIISQIISSLCPSYDSLPESKKIRVLDSVYYEFHPSNTLLSREGATSDSVYILLSGEVEVSNGRFSKIPGLYKRKILELVKQGVVLGAVDPNDVANGRGMVRNVNLVTCVDCDFVRLKLGE